jgi:hypothetical protein
VALPAEGLYRVREAFDCCAQRCRTFQAQMLVQLGFNGAAEPILFVPEWTREGLAFPAQGFPIDPARASKLELLSVAQAATPGGQLH